VGASGKDARVTKEAPDFNAPRFFYFTLPDWIKGLPVVGATRLSSRAFVGLLFRDPTALTVAPLLLPPVPVAEFDELPVVAPVACVGADELAGLDALCASTNE
jgi:hypothetical protein